MDPGTGAPFASFSTALTWAISTPEIDEVEVPLPLNTSTVTFAAATGAGSVVPPVPGPVPVAGGVTGGKPGLPPPAAARDQCPRHQRNGQDVPITHQFPQTSY